MRPLTWRGAVTRIRAIGGQRPGAWFAASIVHPCFPGNELGRSRWPPGEGYDRAGWWTSPDHNPAGIRRRVGTTHRKLSTFLNAMLEAGPATGRAPARDAGTDQPFGRGTNRRAGRWVSDHNGG